MHRIKIWICDKNEIWKLQEVRNDLFFRNSKSITDFVDLGFCRNAEQSFQLHQRKSVLLLYLLPIKIYIVKTI